MKLWVGRILLVCSAILVIIAIASAMRYPSFHTISTQTYSTTETYDVEEIVTSSTFVTVVQEITLSHVTTRSLYEFSSNFDEELFALGMPVSFETVIETIQQTYSTTETYDVEEIVTSSTFVTVVQEITLSHVTTRSLYEFSSNFDEELFALGMPVSFETVIETIQQTYSYTTGSYDKSYSTIIHERINPFLIEQVLINTQSFFPSWIIIPCIITAIGLMSAFILMKYKTIHRSMNNLGVLLLEDKYYCREELVGKNVFKSKGMKIGEVVNVGYSKNGKVALSVEIAKGNVKIISFRQIGFIGDIILLSSKAEREKEFKDLKRSRLSEKDDNFLDNFFHAE